MKITIETTSPGCTNIDVFTSDGVRSELSAKGLTFTEAVSYLIEIPKIINAVRGAVTPQPSELRIRELTKRPGVIRSGYLPRAIAGAGRSLTQAHKYR
jgi:hypothetical protein